MNWGRLVGLGIGSLILITATNLSAVFAAGTQQEKVRKPVELADVPEGEWEPIAQRQWARVATVSGDKVVVSVLLTSDAEVFFGVVRSCPVSSESSILMWRAGSSLGYTLDCAKKGTESVISPSLEMAIGGLPTEVSYSLRWNRMHPKQTRSRAL